MMLSWRGLSGGYAGQAVFRDVCCDIPQGRFTILLGPNGCGKSTLLRMSAGLQSVLQGEILLEGRRIDRFARRERAQRIAYLPQNPSPLAPDFSVRHFVLQGRYPYAPRAYTPQDQRIAQQTLSSLALDALADKRLGQLSGGEKQLASLAMLFVRDCPVLLLDEPCAGLDIRHQLLLMARLKELARSGRTVIAVVHDLRLALESAEQLIVLAQGGLRFSGDADALLSTDTLPRFFGVQKERDRFVPIPPHCAKPD